MTAITQNDVLDALRAAMAGLPNAEDGITRRELVKATGRSVTSIRNWLVDEIEAGRIECVKVGRARCDGVVLPTTAYRVVK